MQVFNQASAVKLLPLRKQDSHKGSYGKLLLLAGSEGFWGSGILAASAAYRMGCGYVYWAAFENPSKHISDIPEVLTLEISKIKSFKNYDAVVIGPGLGFKLDDVFKKLLNEKIENVVLDADALIFLSTKQIKIPSTWILTPHPGEMGKLLGITTEQVQKDRFNSLKQAFEKLNCHILLKGHKSLAHAVSEIYEIDSGNSGLSKAGSGDVLSGFIGSLLAQGLSSPDAMLLGTYIHGALADLWSKDKSERALMPSDLKDLLPNYLKQLEFLA